MTKALVTAAATALIALVAAVACVAQDGPSGEGGIPAASQTITLRVGTHYLNVFNLIDEPECAEGYTFIPQGGHWNEVHSGLEYSVELDANGSHIGYALSGTPRYPTRIDYNYNAVCKHPTYRHTPNADVNVTFDIVGDKGVVLALPNPTLAANIDVMADRLKTVRTGLQQRELNWRLAGLRTWRADELFKPPKLKQMRRVVTRRYGPLPSPNHYDSS